MFADLYAGLSHEGFHYAHIALWEDAERLRLKRASFRRALHMRPGMVIRANRR